MDKNYNEVKLLLKTKSKVCNPNTISQITLEKTKKLRTRSNGNVHVADYLVKI